MKLIRKNIGAGVEEKILIMSNSVTVANLGFENLYVNFDKEANIESLLLPPKIGRQFNFGQRIKSVHVFSNEGTEVQIDDVR